MLDQATREPPAAEPAVQVKTIKRSTSPVRFFRDPVSFFSSVTRHGGSLTAISLGKREFYIVSDPRIIRDILSTQGSLFEKFPQGNPNQKLFGKGLLTSEGAAQKAQRRMLLPGFHRDRLQHYARTIVASAETLAESWVREQRVDVASAMNDLTLKIIGRTLLGVDEAGLIRDIGTQLHIMLKLVNRFVLPWGDWLMRLPLPSTIRYRRAVNRLDHLVRTLVETARRRPSNDLTSMLLRSQHSDGTPLSDIEVRDEIVTMIVAGHETVAVALTWTLFLLASNHKVQDQIAGSLAEVLGTRSPDADDYGRLEFLQHAFAESLRLHPPIWILGRRNLEEYTFQDFRAAKGSIFLVCMADLHRRPELFSDPESFKPDRWQNPNWPAYAFVPFGGGERRCIGERFAWMEAVLILACLLNRYSFSVIDSDSPATVPGLTLHPRGPVMLQLRNRSSQ